MKKLTAKRLLVLPDVHVPIEDKRAIECVLAYAEDEAFDEVIQLGDLLDLEGPSSHAKGKPRQIEGQRFFQECEIAREFLTQLRERSKSQNKECSALLLEGNHEFRLEKFLDEHPYFTGALDLQKALGLRELGYKWQRYTDPKPHRAGKLHFVHGLYHSGAHAKKHAIDAGVSLMYGHTHTVQMYTHKTLYDGACIRAWSIGCLCDYRPKYLHGSPTSWQHAFADVWVDTKGSMSVSLIEIHDGRMVAPNGIVYEASKTGWRE